MKWMISASLEIPTRELFMRIVFEDVGFRGLADCR